MSSEIQFMFWGRTPGKFVNKQTGEEINVVVNGQPTYPNFTGTVVEWYETLVETTIDMRNALHNAAVLVLGPCTQEAANIRCGQMAWSIITSSILYKPNTPTDGRISTMTAQLEPNDPPSNILDDEIEVDAAFKTEDGRRVALQGLIMIL